MEETKQETNRDEQGRFIPGVSGNPDGRPVETPELKIIKKATKELIAEYKEALGEALPMIRPILIAKAMEGDMTAIKEIHDRTMDKAKQPTDITTDGQPITVTVPLEIANAFKIDANKTTNEEAGGSNPEQE